jgi:hypothetical protein
VRELATALRALRRAAGGVSYRQMAVMTHYSAATLARAASGAGLPSLEVTLAYAAACGGDRAEWADRWDRAQTRLMRGTPEQAAEPAPAGPAWPAAAPATPVPRQLPVPPRLYTGRARELAELDTVWHAHRTGAMVAVIAGSAGTGKTALALHWAHRSRDRFPHGQLYLNLHGHDAEGPVTAEQALSRLLQAMDVPAGRMPHGLDERAALYRSLLAQRRMFLLLDNAADTEQVRPLLPAGPNNMVIVTSRGHLSGLVARDGAHRITLDVLPDDEATELLRRGIGADRVDDAVATALARQCANLPLALRIAADRVAGHPRSAATLVDELSVHTDRLDVLVTDDDTTAVRTVFSWSYRSLPPDAGRIFRLLGLLPGPDISAAAVAALAGTTLPEARRLLDVLADQHLVEETATGRYRQHDLLRAYAAERGAAEDGAAERAAAVRRLANWYLHTANAAGRPLLPQRHGGPVSDVETGVRPPRQAHQHPRQALAALGETGDCQDEAATPPALGTGGQRAGRLPEPRVARRRAAGGFDQRGDPMARLARARPPATVTH